MEGVGAEGLHKEAIPTDRGQTFCTDAPDTAGTATEDRGNGHASLHTAISKHDLKLCLRLLEDEKNLNILDERDGSTPLHALARRKWSDGPQVVKALLDRGAKANAKDHAENTPLHIMARDGRIDLCKCLLDYHTATGKLNLNVRRKTNQWTPLHYAAEEGQCAVVKLLLDAGADPTLQDRSGWLPVHHAANKGYKDCCRLLASSYKYNGSSSVPPPLALANLKGYYRCCKELDPDYDSLRYLDGTGNTPLHVAAKKGYSLCVELLLERQAPLEAKNNCGNTPLMEAARNNKQHCVKLLVEGGASLAATNHEHSTVLHLVAASKSHKCLEYLLGCQNIEDQLNKKDIRGHTAVSIATEKLDEKGFSHLIEAGASPTCGPDMPLLHFRSVYRRPTILRKMLSCENSDVSISDMSGVTPLHLAAEVGSKKACTNLLNHGARLNALDNNGRSPLLVAAAAGNAEVVHLLVNSRALLRAKEHDTHFTALHAAAAAGSLDCSKILLDADHGLGNEKAVDKYALDVAYEGGHHEVVKLLLENFKTLPKDLRLRLHKYTHRSVATNNRGFLSVMFESKWWEVGCGLDGLKGAATCPNFKDIIVPYPDIASKIMTKCRNGSINDFRLFENTSYASKEDEDGKACLEESGHDITETATPECHPVSVMVGHERIALLQHQLVERWLEYKWRSYACWLFLAMLLWKLLNVAVLFFFLLYTANWTQIEKKHNMTKEEICRHLFLGEAEQEEKHEAQEKFLAASPLPHFELGSGTAHLFLTVSVLLQVFVEWTCFRKMKKNYIDGSLWLRLPCVILSLLALVPTSWCDLILGIKSVYAWECGILALLLSWLDLMHNIDQLPQFTMFGALNMNFLKDYIKGLMYFGMVVFIFSFAFHLLLSEQSSFHSLPQSMVQVVVWMVGDLNYNDNFLNANLDYPLLSTILFLFFVCTVGAFFVTLLQTPSSSKKRIRFLKQTGRINLLLKIDNYFPYFKRLCLADKYDEKEKIPSLFLKIQERCMQKDQVDAPPCETKIHLYSDKLMSLIGNVMNFFQTDDDDESGDDEDDLRDKLELVKGMLEEQAKQLQEVKSCCSDMLQYCEERSEGSLQVTNPREKQ